MPSRPVDNSINLKPTARQNRTPGATMIIFIIDVFQMGEVMHGMVSIPNTLIPSPIPYRAERRVKASIGLNKRMKTTATVDLVVDFFHF